MTAWPFERRLTLALAASVTAVAVLAAIASFVLSFREARELQEDALLQIAAMATGEAVPDAQSRITVLRVPGDRLPPWLPPKLERGFTKIQRPDGMAMGVFVRDDGARGRVIVLQDMRLLDDVAVGAAFEALLPALLLLPLVAWLTLRALASERRSVEAQRRFIADAAHELRGPLTALTLQAENLRAKTSLESTQERVMTLQGGIGRARRVAEQMLTMAHVHSDALDAEAIDVGRLAREVIADALDLARQRNVDLGLDERARLRLWGAPDALRLVVKNAVDNAVRYGREGGSVTVRVSEERGEGVIEVLDDGPGMPPDFIAHAFEPFRRVPSAQPGSGLGLAIAADAARRLGGTIALRNLPANGGLAFTYRQRISQRG